MTTLHWISHRGVRDTGYTENTVLAFRLAVSQGFRWLETDLRLSKDDHIVLSHDPNLMRFTGRHLSLQSQSRAELELVRLPCGQSLLFIDQFLHEFINEQWTFDVKPETSRQVLHRLRDILNQMPLRDQIERKITFLLWSERDQRLAEQLFPQSDFFARRDECWRAGLSVILGLPMLSGIKTNKAYALPPKLGPLNLFTPRIFSAFRQRNAKVIAYLPRNRNDVDTAQHAGADLILSDSLFLDQAQGLDCKLSGR